MSYHDDPSISQAHRKALDARRRLLESRPDVSRLKLPDQVAQEFRQEDCGVYRATADSFYDQAAQAYLAGDVAAGDAALSIAHYFIRRYNDCLWSHAVLDPPFPDRE